MRNGYVGTGGFPPPGGPCAGVPGGLHPRTGLESPSDHVRPEGGAAGCTEGPDSPCEVGCGRCARTGALHPGRSVAHGGPTFVLGRRAGPRGLRACAGGLGGRRGPRTALAGGPASLVPASRPRKGGSSHCLQAQCPGPLPRRLLHPPLAPLTPHAGGHEAPHRLCGAARSPGAGRAGLAAGGPEASLVCRLRSQMGPEAGTGGDDGP